jgi:hypothetical protein
MLGHSSTSGQSGITGNSSESGQTIHAGNSLIIVTLATKDQSQIIGLTGLAVMIAVAVIVDSQGSQSMARLSGKHK